MALLQRLRPILSLLSEIFAIFVLCNFATVIGTLLLTLLHGVLIGILVSAPMGPIGALCIQRTLNKGRWSGFYTGCGAALSDCIYCLLTALSLAFVNDYILRYQIWIEILGSVALFVFGLYIYRRNPAGALRRADDKPPGYARDFATGFLLTFSNPLIIFLILALFARFNIVQEHWAITAAGFLAIGAGALLWWLGITTAVSKMSSRFNVRSLWLVNRIIGSILIAFAAFGFCAGLYDLTHPDTPPLRHQVDIPLISPAPPAAAPDGTPVGAPTTR